MTNEKDKDQHIGVTVPGDNGIGYANIDGLKIAGPAEMTTLIEARLQSHPEEMARLTAAVAAQPVQNGMSFTGIIDPGATHVSLGEALGEVIIQREGSRPTVTLPPGQGDAVATGRIEITGLNGRMPRVCYTPAHHSPEGRLEKLERLIPQLLALMIEGETKQHEDTMSASLGFPLLGAMLQREQTKSYPERLKELLDEYNQYLADTYKSDDYRAVGYDGRPRHF